MLEWLNANAGAVQGITAGVTVLVTLILVAVTWRYVQLTNKMAQSAQDQVRLGQRQFELGQRQMELTQRQFEAACLPYLHMLLRFNNLTFRLIGYRIVNIGQREVQVQSAVLELGSGVGRWKQSLENYEGAILSPAPFPKPENEVFTIQIPEDILPDTYTREEVVESLSRLTLTVVVSDPAGLIRYECKKRVDTPYRIKVLD